ncbi:MAG: paraquat-inducible protein A [Paracoccaceae bacterium]
MTKVKTDPEDLIACPKCDALYRAVEPDSDHRAICDRCGTILYAPREGSFLTVFAFALTVLVLIVAATWFPFISISKAGLHNTASVFDVALSFSATEMVPLTLAVAGMIILVPALRVLLILYVLAPLLVDRKPLPFAALAFRFSEQMRPWAMAEIFVLGVAVALVKVADLAHVIPGPAFWMFVALALIATIQDRASCSLTIWKALERE